MRPERTGPLLYRHSDHLPEHPQGEWFWTLANPRTHRALVSERHGTADEYERWLEHLLACALLADR